MRPALALIRGRRIAAGCLHSRVSQMNVRQARTPLGELARKVPRIVVLSFQFWHRVWLFVFFVAIRIIAK